MSGAAISVTGLKSTKHGMERVGVEAPAATEAATLAAATTVAKEAVRRAPVLSGRLARSIRMRATRASAAVVAGGSALPYAAPIHWGWPAHNIAPQPFLYSAFRDLKPEVLATYEREVVALVDHNFKGGV